MFRDMTERRRLESQMIQSQKMEAVGRLAGGVAHDFNNVLTIVMGTTELILERLGEEDPVRRLVEMVSHAGKRAASLTAQLLAFSRRQVMQPRVLNLNALIAETEKMLLRLIGEDVVLLTRLKPELGKVKMDPGQVDQIIMNLVINARDAMPQSGKIIIETANAELDDSYVSEHLGAMSGSYVMLAITDTGAGMDAVTRARIFEPFFTTKAPGKGTGLGLATVYGIVKQNKGSIRVYSELGRGTSFKIYLPRVEEETDALSIQVVKQAARGGKETILLAEDDEMVRTFAHHILQMNGYSVMSAASGTEALTQGEQTKHPIHLMITDTVMPGINGRELADRIITLHPETRVLFVSGYTDDIIVEHGILQDGVEFLAKPFSPDALARKVRDMLDQTESRR